MIDMLDTTVRIGAGLGLGAAIGMERQWRSRSAGVRTAALVSLGATLFVIMGGYSFTEINADPTRVAAQVASGIGFLGAGVIMKHGVNVSGLNTAATIWAAAAVGALAGGGLIAPASVGAVAVIAANVFLRPIGRTLDRHRGIKEEKVPAEYHFDVKCATHAEVLVRNLVFEAISRPPFLVQSIAAVDLPDNGGVRITATVVTDERDDQRIEAAIAQVIKAPEVTAVRWTVDEAPIPD